MLDRAPCFKFG